MAGGASDDDDLITAINVTPLVDVILVLLIIFMVTAKIIVSQGMPMDLPKAATGENIKQTILSVELLGDGRIMVNSEPVKAENAVRDLAAKALKENKDLRATVRAEPKVEWSRVVRVLDQLKSAKVSKIAFGTNPAPKEDDEKQEPK